MVSDFNYFSAWLVLVDRPVFSLQDKILLLGTKWHLEYTKDGKRAQDKEKSFISI